MPNPPSPSDAWPRLDYADWADTLATVHRWVQIVGKVRLVCVPWINHSWQATFYPTPVGITTSTMFHEGRAFEVEFDFVAHRLVIRSGDGTTRGIDLEPMSVAEFHDRFLAELAAAGLEVEIHPSPNEVPDPVPFRKDTVHRSYDPAAVRRFSQALNQSARVFTRFRARYLGKCSPVHLFWGSFDLAVTRFSGRTAPPHPGGFPALPDWITREAYSHEVSSCGFWPGSAESPAPAYYAYGYPVPPGCADRPVSPEPAFGSEEMAEWFLPYDAVRTAADPDAALLEFMQSTYEAVADLGRWDRAGLEVPEGFPRGDEPAASG